jgi:6,7-dimethyl-8-ribityllumazine synthase
VIHILIIESRYYNHIADMLLTGATSELEKQGATFEIATVPGCLEIPIALNMTKTMERYDGYIVLGCVIRGETTHYDHICQETMRGVSNFAVENCLAVGNGILTVENEAQAIERASPAKKNKGAYAAQTVLSLIALENHFVELEVEDLALELGDEDDSEFEFEEELVLE